MEYANKKFLLVMLVMFAIILASVNFSQSTNFDKIDKNVIRTLDKESKVRVVVQFKEEIKGDIQALSEKNTKKSKKWFSAELTEKEIKELSLREDIEQIVYDYELVPLLNEVPDLVNSTIVWDKRLEGLNLTGQGQSICVIDTGANYSHADLGGGIGEGYKVIGGHDFGNDDDDPMDYNGHGTHVAGIAAANGKYNGTAKGANLVIMKVFTDAGGGDSSDMVSAIEWCTNNASLYNISIITMSLGLSSGGVPILDNEYCDDDYSALSDAINSAVANNITVTAAAGNEANYTHIGMPSCMENATPVIWGTKSYTLYSNGNRNNMSQLFAPGTSVISTKWTGTGNYESRSGSSMSTPAVAGLIAIINQYLDSAGRTNTTQEIESLLNSTGIPVFDSETNLTFSHVDIYSALEELDEENPETHLESPSSGLSSINSSYSFNCNASDTFLENITFYLWNSSSDVISQSNISVSGVDFYNFEVNVSGLDYGSYEWNCLSADSNSNEIFASSNYSLTLQELAVNLNNPSNDSYQTSNEINFSCSSEVNSNYDLDNVTFYLWNSSDEFYTELKEISGNSNVTTFNYSNLSNGNYEWNCLVTNNISTSEFSSSNNTFTYDISSPEINLISPSNSQSYTGTQTLTLSYNVSDDLDISNCSLIVDGSVVSTNSTITNLSATQSFSRAFSTVATYTWSVNCTDVAGNVGSSNSRTLTINSDDGGDGGDGGGGGGGGGSSPITMTFIPSNAQVSLGYNKQLGVDDKIKFEIGSSGSSETHIITLDEFAENYAKVTIESDPVELTIVKGSSEKADITSDGFYDLLVSYHGIIDEKANLTIQTINEIVPEIEEESLDINESSIPSEGINNTGSSNFIGNCIKRIESFGISREFVYAVSAILIVGLVGVYLYIRDKDSKKK